jgi:hypothetical protein
MTWKASFKNQLFIQNLIHNPNITLNNTAKLVPKQKTERKKKCVRFRR